MTWVGIKWLEKGWYAMIQNQPTNQPTQQIDSTLSALFWIK